MNPVRDTLEQMTRRHFFGRGAMGLGAAALASLDARSRRPGWRPLGK